MELDLVQQQMQYTCISIRRFVGAFPCRLDVNGDKRRLKINALRVINHAFKRHIYIRLIITKVMRIFTIHINTTTFLIYK